MLTLDPGNCDPLTEQISGNAVASQTPSHDRHRGVRLHSDLLARIRSWWSDRELHNERLDLAQTDEAYDLALDLLAKNADWAVELLDEVHSVAEAHPA